MDWIARFMEGVELRSPSQEGSSPLDFAVSNESRTLCLTVGWWRRNFGQGGDGVIVVDAPFLPNTGGFDGLSEGLILAGPTDADVAAVLTQERLRTDLDRMAYLSSLRQLHDYEPEFDLNPWTEAILARPRLSPFQGLLARREVGRLRLLAGDGRTLDTLVIDSLGQALTSQEAGWLALFADQWAGYAEAERPDVFAFLSWLAAQPVYVPGAVLEAPAVFSEAGPLANFIERDATAPTT
jgi:hypothetical protein